MTRMNAAVHEAGHAVVALRLGLPISYATVSGYGPPPDDLPGLMAFVRFTNCPPIVEAAEAFDWMLVCLAGHTAELAICPDAPPLLDPKSRDVAIVEELAAWFSPPLVPAKFLIDSAQAAATKAVERDRTIIGQVAESLARSGMLSAGEIASIMAGA